MSKIALNLKEFQHLKNDDKTTTLRHKDGHELTIMHSKLSPEYRSQLEAIAPREEEEEEEEEEPVQMAEGGDVLKQIYRSGLLGSKRKVDQDIVDTKAKRSNYIPNDGKDVRSPEQKAKAEYYDRTGSLQGYATGGEVDDPDASESTRMSVDPNAALKEQYNILDLRSDPGSFEPIMSVPASAPGAMSVDPSAPKKRDINEQNMVTLTDDQRNSMREAMGITPIETAAPASTTPEAQGVIPDQGIAPTAPVAEVAPSAALDPMTIMREGYEKQLAGINQGAAAQAALGDQNAAILANQNIIRKEAQDLYQNQYNELEAERQAHMQDIKDGHIDPEKYWDNHSRIASGIGMILAGFNPTNSPNAAINFIKGQMENNLQAQKANLSSKQNLLSANLQQFGNLRQATDMTRIMQNDIVTNQLQIAAAKAQNPMAKAAALKAAGDLQMETAPLMQKFVANKTVQDLQSAMRKDPSNAEKYITAMETIDPEKGAKLREKFVPGLGLASTNEGAKDLREMQTTIKTVKEGIKRLNEITSIGGKSLSPTLRAEADNIRTQLIGRLRVPLTGPGAMSEGERELLANAIPDPTAIFSLDSRSKKRLETLEKGITSGYRNMAIANGITIPESSAAPVDKNEQARAWLKANPNDPNAASVKQRLGIK